MREPDEQGAAIDRQAHPPAGFRHLAAADQGHRDELLRAIDAVNKGGSVIDPIVVEVLIEARSLASRSRLRELTQRELEVLSEIATGKSNAAIAEALVLTKRAVEKHVNSIFCHSRTPRRHDG